MAELPGSFPDDGFFLVDGVTPFQERVFNKIRLPEEIKLVSPFQQQSNNISLRFLFKNTVVFKRSIAENGKPMGMPPPLVDPPPSVPPEGKPFIIRGKEAETVSILEIAVPPGKTPGGSLFTERYLYRKIIKALPEPY
jgi:hypothetical protein